MTEQPGEQAEDKQPSAEGEADPEAFRFASVDQFVSEFLADVYARPAHAQSQGFKWCPQWWEHAEAVARLEGLWRAFETLRRDPELGAAIWWRDYADPTMRALCDPQGTFAQCNDEQHLVPPSLDPGHPPAWFTDYTTHAT